MLGLSGEVGRWKASRLGSVSVPAYSLRHVEFRGGIEMEFKCESPARNTGVGRRAAGHWWRQPDLAALGVALSKRVSAPPALLIPRHSHLQASLFSSFLSTPQLYLHEHHI